MTQKNPLDTVYFITIPENFKFSEHAMAIDPSIPLPVQRKSVEDSETFNINELTVEQILAGILTILAYESTNINAEYYRSILKSARPEIKKELTEAAILKAKNEDYDIAEEIFSALRGLDPEDMSTILNTALFFDERAEAYRRSGLIEDADAYDADALNYYKEAMGAEPAIPDAFFNAGFFYLKKYNYHEAKDVFETYIALTCDLSDEEAGENGVYKKNRAQEILDTIKNRNMDDDNFNKAYKLISSNQEESGLIEIKKFIEKNPNVWNAWFLLGWGLRRIERYSDAKQAFLKAIEFGGDSNGDTYNELAICLIEEKKFKEAYTCLENALQLEPENTKIISNLGYLALREGKPAEAARYFQTALEYDPNDKIARAELEKLDR
jgi:tetratricopeptide (TPR) repeat protein